MPWFCWMIIGAFGAYIFFLFLGFLFSRKIQKQEEEDENDIILYEDVQLFIFAHRGEQVQLVWDFSQYAQKNIVAVQVTYDDVVINMMPEEMREEFRSDEEWSWAVLPHTTVWRQGEVFGWFMG